jgi:hypothetical protein
MEISATSLDRLTPAEIGLLLIPGSPWELDSDELRAVDSYAEARGMTTDDADLRRGYLQVCVTVADELRDRPADAEEGYQSSIVARICLVRNCGGTIDEVAQFAIGLLRGLYPSPEAFARSRPTGDPDPDAGEPMYVAHRNAIAVCLAMCIVFFAIENPAVAGTIAPWLESAAGFRPENEWLSRWAARWRARRAD